MSRSIHSLCRWLVLVVFVSSIILSVKPQRVSASACTSSPTNLALGKTALASSVQMSGLEAYRAVDGNLSTRWSSTQATSQEWIYVDLGSVKSIAQVVLRWEGPSYSEKYNIDISDNAIDWTTVSTQEATNPGDHVISVVGSARYVRMNGLQRGTTGFGHSLYEFEVYDHAQCEVPATPVKPDAPTPTQGRATLFFDDFEGGADARWQIQGDSWNVSNGVLTAEVPCGSDKVFSALVGDSSWKNYEVQFDFKGIAGANKQFQFRTSDAGRYLWQGVRRSNVVIAGGGIAVTPVSFNLLQDTWYRVRIRADGNHFQVFMDDNLVIDQFDPNSQWTSGGVGPLLHSNTIDCPFKVQYDNVVVTSLDYLNRPILGINELPPPADGWQWPVSSTAVVNGNSDFTLGDHLFTDADFHHPTCPHHGIDFLALPDDHQVYAIADGKVVVSKEDSATQNNPQTGYGDYIIIEHNVPNDESQKIYSLYAHLEHDSARVDKFQLVRRGDWIATQGKTGGARDTYHVHFELRRNDMQPNNYSCPNTTELYQIYYDPLTFIMDSQHWWEKPDLATTASNLASTIVDDASTYADTISPGEQSEVFKYSVSTPQKYLTFSLNFPVSALEMAIYRPDGSIYGTYLTDNPPALINIRDPEIGDWGYSIRAVEVPYANYPFAVGMGTRAEALPEVEENHFDDMTAPSTQVLVDPPIPNGNGLWYTVPVTVNFSATDNPGGIGVSSTRYTLNNAAGFLTFSEPFLLTNEGSTTITYYSVDGLANEEIQQSTIIHLDLTPPIINAALQPPTDPSGWYNLSTGAPTIKFSCQDGVSGLAPDACPGSHAFGEGLGQSYSTTVTDIAGNSNTSGVTGVNVDLTQPTLHPIIPSTPILVNSKVSITPGATDSLSGIASQHCESPDTSSVGNKSVLCTVVDQAGNTVSQRVNYIVIYRTISLPLIIDTIH